MSKSGRPLSRTRRSASAIVVSVRKPEEVELDQADLLDAAHVELRDDVAGARVAVERHRLDQRARADHDAGRVRGRVARQALEALRRLEQLLHLAVGLDARAQLGRLLHRLLERDAERLRGSGIVVIVPISPLPTGRWSTFVTATTCAAVPVMNISSAINTSVRSMERSNNLNTQLITSQFDNGTACNAFEDVICHGRRDQDAVAYHKNIHG